MQVLVAEDANTQVVINAVKDRDMLLQDKQPRLGK